jgi:hypothetical protein
MIAVAVGAGARREIPRSGCAGRRAGSGPHPGPSEAETFWARFPRSLLKRGLEGVKLAVSDAHGGLAGAIRRVLGATRQRCRVHRMRSALAHVHKGRQTMVAAALRQAFLQADEASARQVWRQVADQLRPRRPKLSAFMDESGHDVLAYLGLPARHRAKPRSANPLERLDKEVKRRAGARPPAGAAGPGGGRHLAGRGLDHPPDRRRVAGAERRAAAAAPLHAGRGHGRADGAGDRARTGPDPTPGRLTGGHLTAARIHASLTDAILSSDGLDAYVEAATSG